MSGRWQKQFRESGTRTHQDAHAKPRPQRQRGTNGGAVYLAGIFAERAAEWKRTVNYRLRNASPAFGNPARSESKSPTSVALRPSFTRSVPLSFQVLLQITTNPDVMSWPLELSKRNFNVSTRFISAFIKPSKS